MSGQNRRDFLAICLGIFGGSVGGDDAGNCLGDGRSVSGEIIGGAPSIQTIAEIFVVMGEQRMDHRKTHAIDRTPTSPRLFVRLANQTVDGLRANLFGGIHGILALMLLDKNGFTLSLRGVSDGGFLGQCRVRWIRPFPIFKSAVPSPTT
jgi:hypothetical protein